jgi:hypothetical protein
MRFALALALYFVAIGAFLRWGLDVVVWGADGDMIGTLLMVVGGAGVVVLIILSASRAAAVREGEPIDEPDDRLTARWSRR